MNVGMRSVELSQRQASLWDCACLSLSTIRLYMQQKQNLESIDKEADLYAWPGYLPTSDIAKAVTGDSAFTKK